jgi:hypothetical protein
MHLDATRLTYILTALPAAVLQGQADLVRLWGPSLLHVDDLPYQPGLQDMPDVFTRFREQVEQDFKVRKGLALQKHIPLSWLRERRSSKHVIAGTSQLLLQALDSTHTPVNCSVSRTVCLLLGLSEA